MIDNILKEDLKRTHFKKCFLNKKRKKPDCSNDKAEKSPKIVKIRAKMRMKMKRKIKRMKILEEDYLIKMEI